MWKPRHMARSQGEGALWVHGGWRACEELGEVLEQEGGDVQ